MRSGEPLTLSDILLDISIHDLKAQYAQNTSQAPDKIKLLYNKKPAADLKTLKELGIGGDVELSVMVMGGAGATPSATSPVIEKTEPPLPPSEKTGVDSQAPAPMSEKAQAEAETVPSEADTTADILMTEEFWSDLKGFLAQRLRDQKEGEKLAQLFRDASSKR